MANLSPVAYGRNTQTWVMRKKWLSHYHHLLSQAYIVFQVKAACDPPTVEMGRDFYWIIPSNPSQIKSPDIRQRDINRAFQSWPTVSLRSRKKSSSGQEPACLEGASLLVCVYCCCCGFPPTHPFPKAQWSDCVPYRGLPF